jgi:hypothetical protein
MRSYYATLMLALSLSSVSIPSIGANNEGTVSPNSQAQIDSSRQGGSENSKQSSNESNSNGGSSAASAATSESSPFRNVLTPGLNAPTGNQGPSSNYVKNPSQPSNYVKSSSGTNNTPVVTTPGNATPYSPQGLVPSDNVKGTPSNYVTGSGTTTTPIANKVPAKKKAVSHKPVTRNWR